MKQFISTIEHIINSLLFFLYFSKVYFYFSKETNKQTKKNKILGTSLKGPCNWVISSHTCSTFLYAVYFGQVGYCSDLIQKTREKKKIKEQPGPMGKKFAKRRKQITNKRRWKKYQL